jgi:hypothetical protein
MRARKELIESLLSLAEPTGSLMQELKEYGWDSEYELGVLTPEHMKNVLKLYLVGSLSENEVIDWANAIEQRDDIGFLQSHAEVLEEMVFWLSNPSINYSITPSLANRILLHLENNTII